MKTCTKCKSTKPASEFYKNQGRCKTCQRANNKAYYAKNRQKELKRKEKAYFDKKPGYYSIYQLGLWQDNEFVPIPYVGMTSNLAQTRVDKHYWQAYDTSQGRADTAIQTYIRENKITKDLLTARILAATANEKTAKALENKYIAEFGALNKQTNI